MFFFFWTFGFLVHVWRSLEVDAVAESSRCEWVDDEGEGFSIATIIWKSLGAVVAAMEANALVAAGEGQSTYEGDEMVVPVMSETSAVLLLVGLFLAAMSKFYMQNQTQCEASSLW